MKNHFFSNNQIIGFILIILSVLLWFFRPFNDCKWYEIFCHSGNLLITPVIVIICAILLIVGIIKLTKKEMR